MSRKRGSGKGYVMIGTVNRQYEHRLIAAAVLGRPLPKGVEVHHHDKVKGNNVKRNLVICENHAYHVLLHRRTRVLHAGGDPNTEAWCGFGKHLAPITSFYRRKSGKEAGALVNDCKPCGQTRSLGQYHRNASNVNARRREQYRHKHSNPKENK